MKKNNFFAFLGAFLLFVLFFVSCEEKTSVNIDEFGFYINIEAAEKAAKQSQKDILVIVTTEGDDLYSEPFLQITKTEEFKNTITNNFTVLHFDFSQKTFESTVVKVTDSKEMQKTAKKMAENVQQNLQFARLLNVQNTPSFYYLTCDEYYVGEFDTYYVPASTDQFVELMLGMQEKAKSVKEATYKTKNGTTAEKLAAIDELYESTDYNYRVFLADLVETYIKLDKDNKSGLLGKYLYADGENIALNYFTSGNLDAAVNQYESIAKNVKVGLQNQQKAYLMAAMMLMASDQADISRVIQLLTYGIQTMPDGEFVEIMQTYLNLLQQTGED